MVMGTTGSVQWTLTMQHTMIRFAQAMMCATGTAPPSRARMRQPLPIILEAMVQFWPMLFELSREVWPMFHILLFDVSGFIFFVQMTLVASRTTDDSCCIFYASSTETLIFLERRIAVVLRLFDQ